MTEYKAQPGTQSESEQRETMDRETRLNNIFSVIIDMTDEQLKEFSKALFNMWP